MNYTLDSIDPEERVDSEHPQTGIWISSLCLEICKHVLNINRGIVMTLYPPFGFKVSISGFKSKVQVCVFEFC